MEPEVETLANLIRGTHERLRNVVAGLDPAALAYTPAPETNSIAVLVRHSLTSEASMLSKLADRNYDRNYARDFTDSPTTAEELAGRLDEADRMLDELCPLISRDRFSARYPRPMNQMLSGEEWMIHHYGHAKEHVAHAELTIQVYRASQA